MHRSVQAELGAAVCQAFGGRNRALRRVHPDKHRDVAGGVDAPPYAPAGALLRITAPNPGLGLVWVGLGGHREPAPVAGVGDGIAVRCPAVEGTYHLAAAAGGGSISSPVIVGPPLAGLPQAYALTHTDLCTAVVDHANGTRLARCGGLGTAHTPLAAVLAGPGARAIRAAYEDPAATEDESGIKHLDVKAPGPHAFLLPGGDTKRHDAYDVAARPADVAPGGVHVVYADPPGYTLERIGPTAAGAPAIRVRTAIAVASREEWHCGWQGQVVTVQPACGGYGAVAVVVEVPPAPKETQELYATLTTAAGHTISVLVVCTVTRTFPDVEAVLDRGAYRALIKEALALLRLKRDQKARRSSTGKIPQAPSKQPPCRRLYFA